MATPDYLSVLQQLFAVNRHGNSKCGLDTMRQACKLFGSPEKKFRTIHVGGSNGKGSVSTKIAKAFQLSGCKTGLFTSPHISSFRERIKIDDVLISEGAVQSLLTEIFEVLEREEIFLTFFELTTLLAFRYFAAKQVDIAVIEVGLGGRLDATNIVSPLLSAITSLSLEHTAILGHTLPEIAREKAGIIKPDVPIVIGPRIPLELILPYAQALKSPCNQVNGGFDSFDEENSATAKLCLKLLDVPEKSIVDGCKALPPCRMEEVHLSSHAFARPPKAIFLDVAHNPDGLESLFKALKKKYPSDRFRIVCGLSGNKEIGECVETLRKHGAAFHLVEAQHPRILSSAVLYQEFIRQGTSPANLIVGGGLEENLTRAIDAAITRHEVLVACGSFFIMPPIRAFFGIHEPHDPV